MNKKYIYTYKYINKSYIEYILGIVGNDVPLKNRYSYKMMRQKTKEVDF